MSTINSTDLTVRIELIYSCIATKANKLALQLLYGGNCTDDLFTELRILNKYVDMMERYVVDSDTNCMTEDQLKIIIDKFSQECNICFRPYGFEYVS